MYAIGKFSKATGISTSTLRRWDREDKFKPAFVSDGGTRYYSDEQLNKILAERTGQPLEKIQQDTERDYYLSAAEAQTYGLVDQVIEKRA